MTEILIMLAALTPVLLVGAFLVELLLASAARRGKRPDDQSTARERGVTLRVSVGDGGGELRGSPRAVVSRLLQRGWGRHPIYLSARDAEARLRCWEEEGRVRVRPEWRG
jgi:hypothetical protein